MIGQPATVAVVADCQLVTEGLAAMLAPFTDRVRVVALETEKAASTCVDVALYDVAAAGVAFSPAVKARHRVLWTTRAESSCVTAALTRGAHGVLAKWMCPGELVEAIERVAGGEVVVAGRGVSGTAPDPLECRSTVISEREADILALICQALSNEQIAAALYLSVNTMKSYIRTSYRKMGVSSRSQAVLWGLARGFGGPVRADTEPERNTSTSTP